MGLRIKRAWRKNAAWEGSAKDWTDRLHDMAARSPMDWTIGEFSSLRRVLSFLQSRESRAVPDREGMPLLRAADVAADKVAHMCGLRGGVLMPCGVSC